MDPNVFETANAGFAQVMYEEFLRDPASVDTEWRLLFESGVVDKLVVELETQLDKKDVTIELDPAAAPEQVTRAGGGTGLQDARAGRHYSC